jgi:hypothetical protein
MSPSEQNQEPVTNCQVRHCFLVEGTNPVGQSPKRAKAIQTEHSLAEAKTNQDKQSQALTM